MPEPGSDKNVPARKGSRGATVKSKRLDRGAGRWGGGNAPQGTGLKPKDLAGVPWRAALALQADGWTLRRDVIWAKPNPMPETVKDRPTTAHEYLFLLSKSRRYYYEAAAIREACSANTHARSAAAGEFPGAALRDDNRRRPGVNPKAVPTVAGWATGGTHKAKDWGTSENWKRLPASYNGSDFRRGKKAAVHPNIGQGERKIHFLPKQNEGWAAAMAGRVEVRNKRSVWTVPTFPYKEAHYATYPPNLIRPCILASCPPGGTVLDPFGGSGTTGMVALQEGRHAVLIELKAENAAMIRRRCAVQPGLPL